MQCVFVVPGELPGPSGGTHYNVAVVDALRDAGHIVAVRSVPGAWPHPSRDARGVLAGVMSGPHPLVVDGIIALAAPDAVRSAVQSGTKVHILVHSLLTAGPAVPGAEGRWIAAQERAALQSATSASCASLWSVRDVERRHPGVHPHVLTPGTLPASLAMGSTPPQLLVLAAVSRIKNQLTVLRALSTLQDLPWSLQIVGSLKGDPDYARMLSSVVGAEFLPGRVTFRGALTGDDLAGVWQATDLLVLTSTSETFGMVVTEALSRGIPAVVSADTGAEEALFGRDGTTFPAFHDTAGALVDPCDADELAHTVRTWLTDPGCRARWREAAVSRRPRLQTWATTAAGLARILQP